MTRSSALTTILRRAGDFFFPPGCLSCASGTCEPFEGGVCRDCWDALPAPALRRCHVCDLPVGPSSAFASEEGDRCGRCLVKPPAFDALRSASPYAGITRDIVKAFKYEGADFLASHLAERMARVMRACGELDGIEAVVPVPATRKEKRAHGFFPAGELAREISRLAGKPLLGKELRKTRETARQAKLPLEDRVENVRGAFRARHVPARVLLVDDVATSGATLSACARELKRHGARRVIAIAFGRAIPEDN